MRPVALPDDLEGLFVVAKRCEEAAVEAVDTTRADIASLFTSPEADLVNGTRVAVDEHGAVAGFVALEVDSAGREVMFDAYVNPGVEVGVWDTLLAHAWSFGAGVVGELDNTDRKGWGLAGGCHASDRAYAAALTRAGMTPVRRFHTMEISVEAANPPTSPVLPTGVAVTSAAQDENELDVAHLIWRESFADHWRYVDRTRGDFLAHMRSRAFDPGQWWIVRLDGVPAGVCIGDDRLAELGTGYISVLGVRAEFRDRGIGRLMLEWFFAQAAARGQGSVKLGVDTENGTGAPALYRAVGMRPVQTIDAWERPLT